MATWKLSPQYKKSAVEKMFFYKEGKVITIEQGFRWATFSVESDERPLTDEELRNEDGYELGCIDNDECWEMWEMMDGCWLDIEASNDKATDADVEEFEAAWEEDSFEGVEALGWQNDETEYYYNGPLELTNEDTGEVFKGEPDEEDIVATIVAVEEAGEVEEVDLAVTEWIPSEINPVHIGAYQVTTTDSATWPFPIYAKWNGKEWDTKKIFSWRGLANDPVKKP